MFFWPSRMGRLLVLHCAAHSAELRGWRWSSSEKIIAAADWGGNLSGLAWYAQQQNVSTVRLDATPLGEVVYRKLGFVPQFELVRMGGQVGTAAHPKVPVHQTVARGQRILKKSLVWIATELGPTGKSYCVDSSQNGVHRLPFQWQDTSTHSSLHDRAVSQPNWARCPALKPQLWIY